MLQENGEGYRYGTHYTALKEWAVAVQALAAGKTIVLLRKGGIREQGNSFTVPHDQVLLYPTYEHQKPDLLKPEYAGQVQPVSSGWHPEMVRIGAWCHITHVLQIDAEAEVMALLPYHVWNQRFVTERFRWRPQQPLWVLLLRVYRLGEPVVVPYQSRYGGCRSWIDLDGAIAHTHSRPVLAEEEYHDRVALIQTAIARSKARL